MNNDSQRLAVMQTLYNELGNEVSARNPDGLRAKVDDALLCDYAENGTDRRRISINGEEVATLSIRFSKEHARAIIEDCSALADWMADPERRQLLVALLREKGQAVADWYMDVLSGEIPDGCSAYVEPKRPNGTVLKVDRERIISALGMNLPQAMVYALTDGGEA